MSITILSQVKCTLTKHKASAQDEDLLFDVPQSRVETECEKCHTPIILERVSQDDDFYFISEYVEEE